MTPLERCGLVAIGGAAGALLRYGAALQFGPKAVTTFWVNVTGSFLIGMLAACVPDPRLRLLLGTGLLGGYTTFSTWQLEAFLSARVGDWKSATLNLVGSVMAGLFAVLVGYLAGEKLR